MSTVVDFDHERRSSHKPNKKRKRVGKAKHKSKKRRKKHKSKKKLAKHKNKQLMSALTEKKNKNKKEKKDLDLPIITEEDNEDGSFSDSYVPTRYDASGFFSYHTWDTIVSPPDEDRVVRTGPSIWHWGWDLSFNFIGLYDSYDMPHINKEIEIDTWLNLEGPIASWQPLFAAVIWFITSMNILFPVSMISQSTSVYPYNINTDYSHFQIGVILFAFEISSWLTTPLSSFLILRLGPSVMLFIGILLMIISSISLSFSDNFHNLSFVVYLIAFRMLSGCGFNIIRQSSLFLWSCFAKLDMLSSGLGFCVGPVFGDLLFVYLGFKVAYIVYSAILFVLLLLPLLIIIIFKLLSLQQISQFEIPQHIQQIRKPRYDILNSAYPFIPLSIFKFEVLFVTVVGLTALEPTLPIYALDPSLEITVSGALFTFVYLPLLALSSLIGLVYAKSSSKFLKSPKKHVKYRRRGMKYITKTLSINFSQNSTAHTTVSSNSIQLKPNVSKSEKIKLVTKPSWLVKKKRILPSPDISEHNIMIAVGLLLNCIGFNILSGQGQLQLQTEMTNSAGIDLILGLVLISIASAFIIVSCIDSFINGLFSVHAINQTELTYVIINLAILIGPLCGGLMLDLANNNFVTLSRYWSALQCIHFVIYLLLLALKYMIKFCTTDSMDSELVQSLNHDMPVLKQRIKPKDTAISNKAYLYGTDLRHLCWWKRGLNVRFPYVQWMESGWSSTHQFDNHSHV